MHRVNVIACIAMYCSVRKDFFMLQKAIFFISALCVLSYLIGKKAAKVTVMYVRNKTRIVLMSLTCLLFVFLYFPYAKN